MGLHKLLYTVEPLYNRQVGAGAFVRYSEVSFIGRFHHNVYLTLYSNPNAKYPRLYMCGTLGCMSQTQPQHAIYLNNLRCHSVQRV